MFAQALDTQFARDVRAGLTQPEQKTLPCRYLYDDIGSALFDAITFLPEYGLTRADARVIEAHADDLLDCLPASLMIAELGSGSGAKTRTILERVRKRQSAVYYPIDVSASALARCAQDLSPLSDVVPLEMSYLDGLSEVASRRAPGQRLLVLFLGSTIGNFEPADAIDFVDSIRRELAHGDALLLGTDLEKPEDLPALLRQIHHPHQSDHRRRHRLVFQNRADDNHALPFPNTDDLILYLLSTEDCG